MHGRPGRPLSGRPLAGRPLRGWGHGYSFNRAGGAPVFSPLSLSPSLWLDPSDLTTLFQDSAGTTPVTANNDPVGRINDKSGNGRHLIQATAAARPFYKTAGGLSWLEGDGVDDLLASAADHADISGGIIDRVSAWRILTAVDGARLFGIASGLGSAAHECITRVKLRLYGDALAFESVTTPTVGTDFVLTDRRNGASSRAALDNNSYVNFDASTSVGVIVRTTLLAFQAATAAANARFYGEVHKAGALTDSEIAQLRTYLAAKQGRSL